jgi:hypothetical protein
MSEHRLPGGTRPKIHESRSGFPITAAVAFDLVAYQKGLSKLIAAQK